MIIWGIIIAVASFILGGTLAYKIIVVVVSDLLTELEVDLYAPVLERLRIIEDYLNGTTSSYVSQEEILKLVRDCKHKISERRVI